MKRCITIIFAHFSMLAIALSVHQECFGLFTKKQSYKKLSNKSHESKAKINSDEFNYTSIAVENTIQALQKKLPAEAKAKKNALAQQAQKQKIYDELINVTTLEKQEKKNRIECLNTLGLYCLVYACNWINKIVPDSGLSSDKVNKQCIIIFKQFKTITQNNLNDIKQALNYCLYKFEQSANFTVSSQQDIESKKTLINDELNKLNTCYQEIKNAVTTLNGSWKLPNEVSTKAISNFFKKK